MVKFGLRLALKFRNDSLSEYLAKFDSPLIERINVPNSALGEDQVLVKGNKLTQCLRREPLSKNRGRWAITFEHSMRYEPIGCAFCLHFV